MKPTDFHELCGLIRHDANVRRNTRERVDTECTGKQRFATFSDADRTLRGELRKKATAYHCRVCNGYHIGGRSRGRRLAIERRRQCG